MTAGIAAVRHQDAKVVKEVRAFEDLVRDPALVPDTRQRDTFLRDGDTVIAGYGG